MSKYDPSKHQWGTDASTKRAKELTPNESKKDGKYASGSKVVHSQKRNDIKEKTMPLSAKDPIAKWIDDFKKSDAPQFKGKSGEDRKAMAIAAYMDAKKGAKQEKGWDSEARQVESTLSRVDIEGLGPVFVDGSPSRVKTDLRKMFKKPDYVKNVERATPSDAKKYFRGMAAGKVEEDVNEDPCWHTHKKVGTKMKNGKRVNDCVPKSEGAERKVIPAPKSDMAKRMARGQRNDPINKIGVKKEAAAPIDEISSELKSRYRTKARGDVDNQYKKGDAAAVRRDKAGVKQSDRRVMTRRQGIQRSLPKDGPSKSGAMVPTRNKNYTKESAHKNEELKKVECPKCEGEGCSHCDNKGYHMSEKTNNLVAKHARKFNKAHVMADRKRKEKKGYVKHKGNQYKEEVIEATEKHIRMDNMNGPEEKKVLDILRNHEAKGDIVYTGETDKGIIFKIKKPAAMNKINAELKKASKSRAVLEMNDDLTEFLMVKKNPMRSTSSSSSSSSSSRSRRGAGSTSGQSVTTTSGNGYKIKRNIKTGKTSKSRYNVGGSAAQKESIEEATSKKLMDKMKELSPKGLPRNSAELRKLKAKAQDELRSAAKAKKAAPKKQSTTKTSTGKQHMGSMEAGDRNIVMQLRKAQDLRGNHDIIVSPKGRTTRLPKAMIDKLLKRFDSLQKPQEKRKFQIMVTKELRKRAK